MTAIPNTPTRLALALLLACSLGACDRRGTEDDAAPSASQADAAGATDMPADGAAAPADPAMAGDASMAAAADPSMSSADMATGSAMGEDTPFFRQALASGKGEVELSEYAAKNARSAEVKAAAQMLVKDHTDLNGKLQQASGIADAMPTAEDKAKAEEIKAMKGDAFDQAYLQKMSEGHAKSIALYEDTAKNAKNEATRALVSSALPKLREHAAHVDGLRGKPAAR